MDSLNLEYWEKELTSSDSLGFGFIKKVGSLSGGTISIRINFIYKDDEFYTGRFSIRKPWPTDSVPLLADMLEKQFVVKDEHGYYYYLNRRNSHTPLKVIDDSFPISMRELIEPFPSMAYGFKGGFANNVLQGRKIFHELTKGASPENFKQLL